MQQTRAAVVGGAGHSQLSENVRVLQLSSIGKIAPPPIWPETRFVLCHSQRPRGLLRGKTTRLKLGNYLCVAST